MNERRVLLAHIDKPNQCSIDIYEDSGGYQTLQKVISKIAPEELIDLVKQSGLRGCGGAGFPTGMKWSFLPKGANTKYLVCNCNESEPGSFKDRLLIEKDPHQLIEGIILSSYAVGAKRAFIYCRPEFIEGISKLQKAIHEAKAKNYLQIDPNFSLDITVSQGIGSYSAGEETALLNSLEGYCATQRQKPPFPAISGLYGKPTVINNVETLCHVVHIVKNGADWFKSIGTSNNWGTKIIQVSGHVQRPGCYEFPLGITLKDVLEAAGGMLPGREFKACYPGGASGALLTDRDLELSMDFTVLQARKSTIGSGAFIVMDDSTDMVKVAHRFMQFYKTEFYGKCTSCPVIINSLFSVLERIESGSGTAEDMNFIDDSCKSIRTNLTNFLLLPIPSQPAIPILSAMSEFRNEFAAYIKLPPTV